MEMLYLRVASFVLSLLALLFSYINRIERD